MADTQTVLSVIGTMKSRLPDISIKDGQLIFIQDVSTIALDLHGKRNFFNQIVELSTDEQRQSLLQIKHKQLALKKFSHYFHERN